MEQEEVIKIQDFLYRKVRELGSDFVSEADITISMPMWFIELLNYKFINSKLISIKTKVFFMGYEVQYSYSNEVFVFNKNFHKYKNTREVEVYKLNKL